MVPERHAPPEDSGWRRRITTRRSVIAGAVSVAASAGIVAAQPGNAQAASSATPNWFNVVDYGAAGNRTTDDTAAIQAAMTACANNGGGVVYFPIGMYRTTSTLAWTSDAPVVFLGDTSEGTASGSGGVAICLDAASPVNGLAVTNASSVSLSQLDFLADGDNTGGTSIQYAAVYCDGLHKVTIEECFVAAGEGNVGWNTAFQFTDCLGSMVSNCYIAAESQCVWFNGGNGCAVSDAYLVTTDGTGYGGIRMDNDAGTIHIRNTTTFRGDHGFIMTDGTSSGLAFAFIYDLEVNNPAISGLEFDNGSQVWIEQFWATDIGEATSTARSAIVVGPDFGGLLYLHDSTCGQFSGHGIQIQGGSGYVISNCVFGNSGDNSANTYDDLHIAAAAANVTVTGCHFDVDPYYGFAPNHVRSAIYIESGSTGSLITGNTFAASGYGTATVIDLPGSASSGNLNWKPALRSSTGVQVVTGTSYADLSGAFTIAAYEATAGSLYRLVAWGHGTQASGTAANLSVQAVLGTSIFVYTIMDGSAIGAGDSFHWRATVDFLVTATGTSAAIAPGMTFTWSEAVGTTSANAATASADNTSGSVTFNSEVANSVAFRAEWSTTTGSPGISCESSYLECVRR